MLVGSWRSDLERGGFSLSVTEEFSADGAYLLRGHVCDTSECIMLRVVGGWELDASGGLEISVTESNAPEFFPEGLAWRDEIASIGDGKLEYIDGCDGGTYQKERVGEPA